MTILRGKSVLQDIGMGKLVFFNRRQSAVKRYIVSDKQEEWNRYERAKGEALQQLRELYKETLAKAGKENADIFTVHEMLLEEEEYTSSIRHMIVDQNVNLEYAISQTSENLSRMFHSMEDPYMRERAIDIEDISNRMLHILSGEGEGLPEITETCILAAEDLVPSETVKLPRDLVKGFALQKGSIHSHTAILAKSMGVPAVVELGGELSEKWDGEPAAIDGFEGMVYLSLDGEQRENLLQKQEKARKNREYLKELIGKENITKDNRRIGLFANATSLEQAQEAWSYDAGGIGLFRSEVLFMAGERLPGEEEQFLYYSRLLQEAGGREVVVRTIDIGADKSLPYLKTEQECNPALGLRGIRLCLERPTVLKTQLAALYRAGMAGNLKIMYPMIASVEELTALRCLEEEVKEELRRRNANFHPHIPTGIMIETPAAAIISDLLAQEADFFSIGTNDLTQYTLAMDRQNASLAPYYQVHHPAVLRLIQMTVQHAHAAHIPVSICGELAADRDLTETFLDMGIDTLSVSPGDILPIRQIVRECATCRIL